MKTRPEKLDFSFRKNDKNVLICMLEYGLIITITLIAIFSTASILSVQLLKNL